MNRTGRILYLVIVLLFVFVARPGSTLADDWIAVPPEDLAMKDNPKQPGADAMVLYREVNVDAREASVMNYLRIKIFTQAGVKSQADIELPYDKAQESIQAVHGRTIRPDGSIVEFDGKAFDKEIVKGSGIKYLAKTFTMPSVEPGAIIEYKYREQYDDRYYWTLGWTVQYDLIYAPGALFDQTGRIDVRTPAAIEGVFLDGRECQAAETSQWLVRSRGPRRRGPRNGTRHARAERPPGKSGILL